MGESDNSWVLLILAVLPAAVVMYFVWKMDKREKEPVKLLMQFFGLGALSTISAIILELLFGNLLNSALGSWIPEQETILDDPMEKMEFWHKFIYQFINNFFCIALVEEAGKYVMLHVRAWKCPEFDYSYDAIVYAVATSLGFATVENILYVFNSERGVSVAVMRAILSVPDKEGRRKLTDKLIEEKLFTRRSDIPKESDSYRDYYGSNRTKYPCPYS